MSNRSQALSVLIVSTLAFTVCFMAWMMFAVMFGALMDLTGVRSSAFMLMYGVVWVSLIWMYWTEVRGAELMGSRAKPFRLQRHQVAAKQGRS